MSKRQRFKLCCSDYAAFYAKDDDRVVYTDDVFGAVVSVPVSNLEPSLLATPKVPIAWTPNGWLWIGNTEEAQLWINEGIEE